jgi:signal transduction histidine kinase
LPDDCQEPLLRLVEGVERMSRVLEVTGRVLSLFESHGGAGSASVVAPREVASLKTYFDELREEWPEGVTLSLPKEDASLFLDPDWVRVAVRNLVANGVTHGVLPVAVVVRVDSGALVVRVSDAGKTPDFSLKDAALPFHKDEKSTGLGLGLSLVQRIVTLSGGRLRHEAEPTTFELRMPPRNKKNRSAESIAGPT